MINWYLKVVKENYANFKGRASRSEYWYYTLFNIIILFALAILAGVTGSIIFSVLYIIYALGTVVPSLGVIVRRLHDVDKSGWFYFIVLIPLVGAIWLIVLFCTEGTAGENQYGPDPLTNMPDFDFDNPATTV